MFEKKLKSNKSGRAVMIDEMYQFALIPKSELDVAIYPLEKIILEMYEKNEKNRKYESKKKKS